MLEFDFRAVLSTFVDLALKYLSHDIANILILYDLEETLVAFDI